MRYIGKDDNLFVDEGSFEWDDTGNRITLISSNNRQLNQVGENVLFQLDQSGNRITGDLADHYRLIKNRVDPRLEDKEWVVFELNGKPLNQGGNQRSGTIRFTMETGKFSGNNTCNDFFGQYELHENDRISFGDAASARKACPDIETEQLFMDMLQKAEFYSIT